MNISQVEKLTGMKRANIRFYEKYGLLSVCRDETNNYREYTIDDVLTLQKIKLLRCADFSMPEIKTVISDEGKIADIALNKVSEIKNKLSDMEIILQICTVLASVDHTFSEMDINTYSINKSMLQKRKNIIMAEDYNDFSKTYDLFRSSNVRNIDYLIREASISKETVVLDFGSGTGNYAIDIQKQTKAVVYGVEPSDGMREKAVEKNSQVEFIKGNHTSVPLKDKSIDFIYMTDVIHHIPNLVTMFEEFIRLLKPGGLVCIITESYKQIENRFWVKFFPEIIEAEKERYPDIEDIIITAKSCGLRHIRTDTSDKHRSHKVSEEFIGLVENKGFSMFNHISDEAYQEGLAKLKDAYNNGEVLDYTHGESFMWLEL